MNFHVDEKNSNKNSHDHIENLQKHDENDVKHRISFIFDRKSFRHNHIRFNVTHHHQFNLFIDQKSTNIIQSSIDIKSNTTSKHILRLIQSSSQIENEVRNDIQKKRHFVETQNFFFVFFDENHHKSQSSKTTKRS